MAALLGGGTYTPILDEQYRWNTWAMPRTKAGEYDIHNALGKTDPLNENDLADFVEKQKTKPDSENSWSVNVADLDENYDLSVKNPNI